MSYSHHCWYYLRNHLMTRSTFWPPLPNSLTPYLSLLITENQISVSLDLFLFICLFMDSTFKWYHTISGFVWFILLSIMLSKSIHVVTNGSAFPLHNWILFHCVCVYLTFSLSIHPWMETWVVFTFWLLWISCSEHGGTDISLDSWFCVL